MDFFVGFSDFLKNFLYVPKLLISNNNFKMYFGLPFIFLLVSFLIISVVRWIVKNV